MRYLSPLIDYGLLGFLGLLSVIVVGIYLERRAAYRRFLRALRTIGDETSLALALKGHTHVIGTVASTAPYIGLLGTVLGIMLTFYQMGLSEAINATEIMTHLALALKATAAGLCVALVAVVLNNLLVDQAETIELKWKQAILADGGGSGGKNAPDQ
jgi:biopolymer transport protein ExbB